MAAKPTFAEVRRRAEQLAALRLRVGVFGGTEDDGTPLAEVAAIHEFGAPRAGIPQRSSQRSTMRRKRDEITRVMATQVNAVTTGKKSGAAALGKVGAYVAGEIKLTIDSRKTEGPEPQELKPATIARKGHDLPLVETGKMRDAITHIVDSDRSGE